MGLRWTGGVETEELPGGETVLLRTSDGRAVVLNPIGGVLWSLCDGSLDAEQLAAFAHQNVSGVALQQVRADVEALVRQLVEQGFLEEREPCASDSSTL